MKVLISGARDYKNEAIMGVIILGMKQMYDELGEEFIIVEGEAPGADTMARVIGESLGIEVRKYPADWRRYKKAAGPIRNRQQFDSELPNLVLCFHDDFLNSSGTKDMAEYALSKGASTYLISKLG